jgi:L-fuculose-phosphate aldolase
MKKIIDDVISIGQHLYQQKYIVGSEGNISCRIDAKNILITRSGVCKGELAKEDILTVNLSGNFKKGSLNPSTEMKLHLAAYQERTDAMAVIHAHPTFSVSLMLAGISLNQAYLPESVLLLGNVPTAEYARPSTDQVPESIREYIKHSDIVLLARHGSITVGKTLKEAYQKLEILENTARVIWLAHQIGNPQPLPVTEVKEIQKLRKSVYGLEYPIIPFD